MGKRQDERVSPKQFVLRGDDVLREAPAGNASPDAAGTCKRAEAGRAGKKSQRSTSDFQPMA